MLDAYTVVFAGLLIPAGIASDRFGRRRVMLAGLVVFGIGSGLAALSWSVWWLVAMRAVMGAGGALVLPATLAVVVQVFPAAQRPRAFAIWFAVASGALAIGPVLGGLIVSWWSWAGVFLINLPIVVAAVMGIVCLVPESCDPDTRPLNFLAVGLVTVGLCASTEAVITLGESRPSAVTVVGAGVIASAALGGFGWQQYRALTPMVDFSLYRNGQFAGASAAVALVAAGGVVSLFALTQHLQLVRGYSTFAAGLAVLPLAVGTVLGSLFGGRTPAWIGAQRSSVAGLLMITVGFAVLAVLTPFSGYSVAGIGLFLVGR